MFNKIYEKYNRKIYNFIYCKTRNEIVAEELMQETFVTLYEIIKDEEKSEKEIKNLTYGIAKNKIMNNNASIKRRKEKFESNISEFTEDIIINPENIINEQEMSEAINGALNELTEMQRKVIILVKLKGLSYKETAKLLNKSENEIKQLLYRAKKSFKRILDKNYPDIAVRYKHAKKLTSIMVLVLTASMITGIVYASYKVYEHYIKNPTTYTLEERNKAIDESTVSIKRDNAKVLIENYLTTLEVDSYNIENIELIKDGIYNKVSWSLTEKNKFRIDIDADSGELIKYNSFEIEEINENKKDEESVEKYIEELYKKLGFDSNYKLIKKKTSIQASIKVIDFIYAKSEEDIYNSVIIQCVEETGKVQNILNMSNITNDREIKISKERAIEILKENYEVSSIESVEIVLSGNIYEYEEYQKNKEVITEANKNAIVGTKEIKAIWIIKYNSGIEIRIDSNTGEIKEETLLDEVKK